MRNVTIWSVSTDILPMISTSDNRRMILRWNLLAGLTSSAVSAVVGLLAVPFYLKYLGVEAYGLVGFYAAAQGFLAILDVGLTPTMNREAARAQTTGHVDEARDLLRSLCTVTWSSSTVIAACFLVSSDYLATHWLESNGLSTDSIRVAVVMFGIVIAVRWPMGVYVGALLGSQRVVWLSSINIAMTIISNGGAVLALHFYNPSIKTFFGWMLLANITWIFLIRFAAWSALGGLNTPARPSLTALRSVWKFSLGMAITGMIGAVLTYSDRLFVSRMLPLEALGRYTIATQLAAVTALFVVPTINVIFPALTRLFLAEDEAGLENAYRNGTKMLAAVLFPMATFLAAFAAPILMLWTGNAGIARDAAPILQLLLLGNALNGVMYFPYSLQMAVGASHLTAIMAAFLLAILVPALYLLTARYGAIGAAAAWALINILYLIAGTPLTHRFYLKGKGLAWLSSDVLVPLLISLLAVVTAAWLLARTNLPPLTQIVLGGLSIPFAIATVVATSPGLTAHVRNILQRR